jgi:hypothetical protein
VNKTLPLGSVTKLTQHVNGGTGIVHAADIFDEIPKGCGLLASDFLVALGKQFGDFFGGEILDVDFGGHVEPFV